MSEKRPHSFMRTLLIAAAILAAFVVYRHYTAPTAPQVEKTSQAENDHMRDIAIKSILESKTASPQQQQATQSQVDDSNKTEFQKTSEAFSQEAQKQAQDMNERTKNNGFEVLHQIGAGF